MAKTVPFWINASRGMRRDMSRDQLPRGAVWNLVDYIPDAIGAPARKRGGWVYSSPALSGTSGSYIETVASVPFNSGNQLIAVNSAQTGFKIGSSSAATAIGAAVAAYQWAFHKDLLVLPSRTGAAPKKYSGSGSFAALGGSPPSARFCTVWNSRTVLGGTSAAPRTIYVSGADSPETWDLSNAYFNASKPITGLATVHGMILAFSNEGVERFRGSNPPPGGNLVREWLADNGCIDARTISSYQDNVVWADVDGVYMTDGSSVVDLTSQTGLKHYWTDSVMGSYDSNYTLAGGVWRNLYFVAVMNSTTFVDSLVFDLDERTARRNTNLTALCFSKALAKSDELFFGLRDENRVASTSSMFSPSSTTKEDGDGTDILPTIETNMYPISGLQRVRHAYVSYDLRDAASDNPTLAVSYCTSPEDGAAYTSIGSLAETSAVTRSKLYIRNRMNTIGMKIVQSANSSDTRLYGIELEGHPMEQSRIDG